MSRKTLASLRAAANSMSAARRIELARARMVRIVRGCETVEIHDPPRRARECTVRSAEDSIRNGEAYLASIRVDEDGYRVAHVVWRSRRLDEARAECSLCGRATTPDADGHCADCACHADRDYFEP